MVWQKSSDFVVNIYEGFRNCRDFSFRDQIQRASLSIMNNIAEGSGRRSDKALKNYLLIAKSSAAEVESMLLVSVKLGYLDKTNQERLIDELTEISKMLHGFIKKLSIESS